MIRYRPPYNGKRFLGNLSTGEIHDLTHEETQCQIDEIQNFIMADTFLDAQVSMAFQNSALNPNGCHYCLPEQDR